MNNHTKKETMTITTNSLYIERTKPTKESDFSLYHGVSKCFEIGSVKANSMKNRLSKTFLNVEEKYTSNGFVSFEFWAVEKDNIAISNPLLKKLF